MLIPLLVTLLLAETWILPQKEIDDYIVSYSKNTVTSGRYSKSKTTVCYKFYTQKGLEFSTEKTYINENDVKIKHSYIFKNITSVKSETKDYSDKLTSGLNGATLWFIIGLTISAIISLLNLRYNKNLSKNGFQNIILFNSLLLFYILYLLFLNN